MNGERYRQSLARRPRTKNNTRKNKENMSSQASSEMPSYRDKSLDISVRLEYWREEKRKQQLSKEASKLKQSNTKKNPYIGDKSNIPLTKTTKLLNKKFKTPIKEYQSPSTKDTYKDTDLDMRTRLELWLKNKGKTPQTATLSNRRFPVIPIGTTPNQRRKTWCYTEPDKKSKSVIITPCRSGILKSANLTDKKTRKTCSFVNWNKDMMNENTAVSSSDGSSWSDKITGTSVVLEEKSLIQTLEQCYEMFEKDVCTQEEIVFRLDDVLCEYPNAVQHALYWICRAKLAENVNDDERVVCMVEQSYGFSAQPKELIQKYFDEYKSRKQIEDREEAKSPGHQMTLRTPYKTPSRELSKLDGEVFNSSVVRFCLIDSTPVRNRRRSGSEKCVLTPVRRTTRWERCGITHPKTIEENRITVASLNELSSPLRSSIIYRPNSLLPCELDIQMTNLENCEGF